MTGLQIDSIRKSFGEKTILQDVCITCGNNEIVGLLGRNGTGKSTIFKIVFRMMEAESYFVRIDNKVIQNQFDLKGNLSYLSQNHFLPRNIRIKEFIRLFCSTENADFLREHSLVKPFLNSKVRELSGGEQRIIEILLIIFSESKFAMLDEPFHSLSPKVIQEIKTLIKEQSKHKGFIISDHNYQDVLEISNRNYLLSETSVKAIQNVEDLRFYKYLH